MRCVVKLPGEAPTERDVEPSLEALQKLIGGYLGVVPRRLHRIPDATVYADEEGLLKGLPANALGLVGPIVVLGVTRAGDDCDLDDEQVESAVAHLTTGGPS